ncbi:MAG: FoF1 ATP synthase subunit gamma [Spirochaetales bacterium]
MAEARDLKQKIGALNNLQKVMQAMNQIATVKLRRLLPQVAALRRMDQALGELARELARLLPPAENPQRTSLVVVYSGDKGLCGPSNQAVIRALVALVAERQAQGFRVETVCHGVKVAKAATRLGFAVVDLPANETLVAQLHSGDLGELYLLHNHFTSTLKQDTRTLRLVPWREPGETATAPSGLPLVLEAPEEAERALGAWLALLWDSALTHARLSEHAARMAAMDNASRNARDLADRYHLQQNRARQGAITSDLIEIISGKEALRRRRR